MVDADSLVSDGGPVAGDLVSGDPVAPDAAPLIREFPLPASPNQVAIGADANVWFTSAADNLIGRMTIAGEVTTFPLSTPRAVPLGISTSPDGHVWFTESSSNRIGRITRERSDRHIPRDDRRFRASTSWLGPMETCGSRNGPRGRSAASRPSGQITEFPLRVLFNPTAITVHSDGTLWFVEAQHIGRMTTSGAFTDFDVSMYEPREITPGPDGNLWLTAGYSQCPHSHRHDVRTADRGCLPGPAGESGRHHHRCRWQRLVRGRSSPRQHRAIVGDRSVVEVPDPNPPCAAPRSLLGPGREPCGSRRAAAGASPGSPCPDSRSWRQGQRTLSCRRREQRPR